MTYRPVQQAHEPVGPWVLAIGSMVMALVAPAVGALSAWSYLDVTPHCRSTWIYVVAVAFLILIVPSLLCLGVASFGLARYRAGTGSLRVVSRVALAVTVCLTAPVVVGGGVLGATMVLFADDLRC
ncbi:hypothetical protein ACWT_3522 [Actinoplanes sp. SE50]|uniref:hypothetical protein n=1 Tax=unclassified Actinoplanes TaxID=2626549 RepID=UPI00023EBF0E|nr:MULTISPECIES: hypothetical protein [unclassified Actinoplanes]AEV84545.1 hypothetical protein ACPL_3650 [Actinoplanes sp. SE50/110]ATO82937.1 hypothetical protein ACWT_3522 [Actinoplanes sp. SE50]SLM00345.1 hypothetical protein ACSP50_3577 [Actinoplanes sp. SE50/110]